MYKNLAAHISLAVVFSASCALSIQSVEAKNSRNTARRAGDYFVPPPPPYAPSLVPTALGMTYAPESIDGDYAVVEKPINSYTTYVSYSKYNSTRNPGVMPQVARPNPYMTYDRNLETKVQKSIDDIDTQISGVQKEIGELLNL